MKTKSELQDAEPHGEGMTDDKSLKPGHVHCVSCSGTGLNIVRSDYCDYCAGAGILMQYTTREPLVQKVIQLAAGNKAQTWLLSTLEKAARTLSEWKP